MKISEMTNDQATEALIRLAGPLENICDDEELIESLDKLAGMNHEPTIRVIGKMIPMIARVGFMKHKQDLYEIVGALTMTTTADVGKMNFKDTLLALQDSYDGILRDFFTSSAIARKISAKK